MNLEDILNSAMNKKASDIHLKAGAIPTIRVHGVLQPLFSHADTLTTEQIDTLAHSLMNDHQKDTFLKFKEIDLGYGISGLGRFRVNIFKQRGTTCMIIRNIPHHIPDFEDLKLPQVVQKIADYERGLILLTGVTGSGKSSTLAAILNHINQNKNKHVLTIEDPIEFLIRDKKSIITQRELGEDATSFARALRAALRQDPDVIFIGEMRDRETIEVALLAAETGHLVLSTLHTLDAQETINRILAVFETHQQQQIRLQLATALKAVISQRLARRADQKGFIPAVEVMINNARVSDLIADPNKTREILSTIEEGRVAYGMQSFDQSLMDLLNQNLITYKEALKLSTRPEDFAIRHNGVTNSNQEKWSEKNQFHKTKVQNSWARISELEIEKIDNIDQEISDPQIKIK